MHLSKYQFQLLKFLYRHPYIEYSELVQAYSGGSIWKRKVHKFFRPISTNSHRLISTLRYFSSLDLIQYAPFCSDDSDTGERYSKDTDPHEHIHILLTELGFAIVEERLQKFWNFVLPYAITTIIAIASLLFQFCSL